MTLILHFKITELLRNYKMSFELLSLHIIIIGYFNWKTLNLSISVKT